jgi:anti-sigma B factor antagonist
MKLDTQGDTVRVSAIKQLAAANASAFRDWIRGALTDDHKHIEIDLSETTLLDSCGLGALIALHQSACKRRGSLRLLHPQPQVQQILDLTRMDRIFTIIKP